MAMFGIPSIAGGLCGRLLGVIPGFMGMDGVEGLFNRGPFGGLKKIIQRFKSRLMFETT